MSHDYKWVIEAPGTHYLTATQVGGESFYWAAAHISAIRFESEDTANAVMMAIRALAPHLFAFENTLGNARAVEHAWVTIDRDDIKAGNS